MEKSLSPERLSTYQKISKGSMEDALKLYLWNVDLEKSLYLPLQTLEILLRNSTANALANSFGHNWYLEKGFKAAIPPKTVAILQHAIKTATTTSTKRKRSLTSGDVIANLTFGFWREFLKSSYKKRVWANQLSSSFPNLPSTKGRQDIYNQVDRLVKLRNRISHHEPIVGQKLVQFYNSILEVTGWISLDTKDWVECHCDFLTVHSNRP